MEIQNVGMIFGLIYSQQMTPQMISSIITTNLEEVMISMPKTLEIIKKEMLILQFVGDYLYDSISLKIKPLNFDYFYLVNEIQKFNINICK
jgi:hypothetical protein